MVQLKTILNSILFGELLPMLANSFLLSGREDIETKHRSGLLP